MVRDFLLEPRAGGGPDAEPRAAGAAVVRRTRAGPPLVVATATPRAGDGLPAAAAFAAAAAQQGRGVVLAALEADRRPRGPTLLASDAARRLEDGLGGAGPGWRAAARGRVCWLGLPRPAELEPLEALARARAEAAEARVLVAHLPPPLWLATLDRGDLGVVGGLVQSDLPADRPLAALAVAELRGRGLRARIAPKPFGRVASRRALAGLEPGGGAGARAARQARALLADRGQAMPAVLAAAFVLVFAALVLAAIGGAVAGKGRLQRAADLAAVSAVRSLRDDVDRALAPLRLPDGSANPAHLSRSQLFARASRAARRAAARNGLAAGRLRVSFPDAEAFPPLRARVEVATDLEAAPVTGGRARRALGRADIEVSAEAEAAPPAGAAAGEPPLASGGGYSGPLVYRQGEGMRPDVAVAFDRLARAARADGISLVVNSGFRSDAEQAELFAANPDPQMVAPPGRSLHRCATELDLGPPSAYAWLAANAPRFGFVQRYSWEPWHWGYDRGPAPCSAAGDAVGEGGRAPDGRSGGSAGLPGFVPARYRGAILRSAGRWNVSAAVLAAQLMAESGFDPDAVSPAGAQGIAQFMPGTAAVYGLGDPFDAAAAIDAQAHLMADLLRQFASLPLALAAYNAGPAPVEACDCVPAIPETQAYVARILGLLRGAGETAVPVLEVKLVA